MIGELFAELVDATPAQVDTRLSAPGASPYVASELLALLAASRGNGRLDRPLAIDQPLTYQPSLAEGDRIGRFVIDRQIGRGGMGEVFAAHRDTGDFDQRVALKLLSPSPTARHDLFDHERRLLAKLEHPGIARLIDGGITDTGRPWMAMEFVDGEPIDAWCRRTRADLPTRLRLLVETCDAVAAAHASLIIHSDLKPSNILVDEAGRVRLLDFGIASIAGTEADRRNPVTADYAAPEQLAGDSALTIAADVHALGVVLYELLTGQSPWRGTGPAVPAVVARALHTAVPLPSQVAGGPFPAKALAGDLDAIVMKAMHPDVAHRYASVAALGQDLVRHGRQRPVAARGDGRRYVFGRFVRRNRIAVAAATTAVIALIAGSAGIAWQAHQTAIERNNAVAEARRSEAINQTLTLMFRNAKDFGAGENATVKDMLGDSATRLIGSLDRSPRSALLINTIADLYMGIEDPLAAETLLQKAMDAGVGGTDPAATAEIALRLATTRASLNKPESAQALLVTAEKVFDADPARFRSERVEANATRAQIGRATGDRDRAIALLSAVLPEAESVYADKPRDLLVIYNNLLVNLAEANRIDEMNPIFARAEAMLKRTGQERSVQALAIKQLQGVSQFKAGNPERAEASFANVVALRRAMFAPSAGLAVDLMQLARVKLALGKPAEALPLLTEARPLALANIGFGSLPAMVGGIGLAEAQAETGAVARAERLLAELHPATKGLPPLVEGMWLRATAIADLRRDNPAAAATALDGAEAIFRAAGPAGESYLKSVPKLRARIAANQATAISR